MTAPPLGAVHTCASWEPLALHRAGDPRFSRRFLRRGTEGSGCSYGGPDGARAGGRCLPTLISGRPSSEAPQRGVWVGLFPWACWSSSLPLPPQHLSWFGILSTSTRASCPIPFKECSPHHAPRPVLPALPFPLLDPAQASPDAGFSSSPDL